ncbi:Coq4 family protein [Plesiocystis pacifica]|uniref:Coq4 family protein n=1 Tax=Plesiocystis pacifica TaxID=191768 RepID=UPI000A309C93|nr:Coq4 family protein [Plesiocystis pacifica]
MRVSPTPIRAPSLLARARAVLHHCSRVLFLSWPDYSFDDLAGIQDNLDGPAFAEAAAHMWADTEGQSLMEDRALLTCAAADWEYFSRLPIDSFGYTVWHHFYVNDLIEDVELQPSRLRWDDDTEYAKARYRSSHDMRHIFLGLGTEVYEEVSLQTFQYAQLPQKLSALVVLFGALKLLATGTSWRQLVSLVPLAWRSGKAARSLHCVRFEALWEVPLDELRARYGVVPVGDRYPVARRHPDAAKFRSPYATQTRSAA